MTSSRVVRVRTRDDSGVAAQLREGIEAIQQELGVTPRFPAEVEEAATRAAAPLGCPSSTAPTSSW